MQNISKERKDRIAALDFIRAMCAIGIIFYHVSCYVSEDAPKFFRGLTNGTVDPGTFLVGVFLMISGGALYYNHANISSLKEFYYKRWRALYPMFYIAFLYFYIKNIIEYGKIFYFGRPNTMLLSLLGMDGYFRYRGPNYYLIGEWFFGAIVFLYMLYPLFAKIVNKLGAKLLFGLLPLWLWQIYTDKFIIPVARNLIYCSGIFLLGMLTFKYELYRIKWLKWCSIAVPIFIFCVPISHLHGIKHIILTMSLFFALFAIGEVVMRISWVYHAFTFLGGISFPIFLVQNQIGNMIVNRFNPVSYTGIIKAIAVTIVLCILAGWCLNAITTEVRKTRWFSALDRRILSKS